MTNAMVERDPVAIYDATDMQSLKEIERLLEGAGPYHTQVTGSDGAAVPISKPLHTALLQIIPYLLRGDAITIVPAHQQLTTQQAADFLNISRPHLVKLLREAVIPHIMVGTHRRVYFRDLLDYKHHREIERRKALDEMTALADEFGIYD